MNSRVGLTAVALLAAALAPVRSAPQRPAQPPRGAIQFRIIVVESADEARRVLDQLAAGANFVALARQVSVDATARSGWLVGPVALADLRAEVRTALERLRVGELSGIVPLPTGFAILKVVPGDEAPAALAAAPGGASLVPMASFTTALGASGGVKYVFDVSGYSETVLSLRNVRDRVQAAEHLPTFCQVRKNLFATAQELVVKALSGEGRLTATDPIDRAQTYFLKAQLHAFEGKMAQAIEAFEQARRIAVAEAPEQRLKIDEALGIAHLHKAEIENGVLHAPGARCLLSDRPGSGLANTADVIKAIGYFLQYLKEKPDEL